MGASNFLGRDGEFDEDGAGENGTAVVASDAAWPREPFWILEGEGAARDLALQLGLLSEQVATPSLCVPMGEEGLALLWLHNDDGELVTSWRPIVSACALQGQTLLSFALRLERMNASLHGLAESVADALDEREMHREGRSRAVAYYAALIAREMGTGRRRSRANRIRRAVARTGTFVGSRSGFEQKTPSCPTTSAI